MAEKSHDNWNDLPPGVISDRLSYVPGTDRKEFNVLWRELQHIDLDQAARIVHHDGAKITRRALTRYANSTGWTGRVVLRNKVSIIGMYLAEHLTFGEYNHVRFFWVHPDYHEHKVPLRLLQLARLELPELPTRLSVNASAVKLHQLLRDAGWTDLTDDNDEYVHRRRDFRIASVAGREYRAVVETGRAAR